MLAVFAVIGTLHLTGAVPVDGGDYAIVPFTVPAGTVEFTVAHDDGSDVQILDWGVWSPAGFRGWGGGLTDAAVVGVAGSSRGYLPGPIAPGAWQVVIGKAKLAGDPGAYTIDLEFRDAATLVPAPSATWTPVTLRGERRWYAGDFHVHSQDSGDAGATLDQIADYARGKGLDFVVLTDHNTSAQYEHQAARQATLTDLLLVRGAEITTYGGHGNGVGLERYVDHRVGLGGVGAPTIIADVHAQRGVFIINHPELRLGDLCIGCGWDHEVAWPEVDGVEIQTGNAELTLSTFTPRSILFWDAALDGGAHAAAIGGSDDHRGGTETGSAPALIGSPTTMVLADALSEQAIVDGVQAGRTVVKLRGPGDPMVILTAVDASDRAHVAELGGTLLDVGRVDLEVEVDAGGDGAAAELWRDGAMVAVEVVAGGHVTFRRAVTGERERYRVELTRDGQRITVTSHVWVEGDPSLADDGCGCSGGVGGAAPGIAIALLALRRRRRG